MDVIVLWLAKMFIQEQGWYIISYTKETTGGATELWLNLSFLSLILLIYEGHINNIWNEGDGKTKRI